LFNKGQYLFNYDKARQYQTVVLVEGVKKALKLPNAVACFGKDLTDAQVQLLTNWKNIIVCLDAQDVAQAIGRRVAASLRAYGLRALNVDLGPYGFPSPDEMTTDQLSFTLYNEWRNYEHTDPL
jgi:DNA primase